jgi:RNA polymerase sigma factor (sigma-70 family)
MQDWKQRVEKAQQGDLAAFDELVRKFRDMAVGYAYTILSDFHQSEDVAQEAFVRAYLDLQSLREPGAFPSWLRRIVFKYCDRYLRKQRVLLQPLDSARAVASPGEGPHDAAAKRDERDRVISSINALPENERTTTTLFYIDGYSMAEVGEFLEVPVSTVKNNLYSARKRLKRRWTAIMKDSLREHAPGDDFNERVRNVLESVPRVSFTLHRGEKTDGLQRCPECFPFPACMRSSLEFMGEDYGFRPVEGHGSTWRLDNAYTYLMGVTGMAFKMTWRDGWYLGNPGIDHLTDDLNQPYGRAFEAVGYGYELLLKKDAAECEAEFRKRIIESIGERRHPVIARGVVGPPEECMIVGFDEGGDVLIGWSYFQTAPEFSQGVQFEPSGYFRKKGWFKDTVSLLLIGDKVASPPREEIYRKALAWALEIAKTPRVKGDFSSGHAAYRAWADALKRDEDLPADNMNALRVNYHVHEDAVGTTAEGRWYAAQFLKQIAEEMPALAEPLLAAARYYEAEHDLMWKIWSFTGGPARTDEGALKLADAMVRKKMIPIIGEARKLDEKAAALIEKALEQ